MLLPYNVGMSPSPVALLVSIVTFEPDRAWLDRTLASLARAITHARGEAVLGATTVVIACNDREADANLDLALTTHLGVCDGVSRVVLSGHGNVGYGRANNLGVNHVEALRPHDVLLVLNPDVEINETALTYALRYLANHADCALVSPVVRGVDGSPQYLAKRFPTPWVLALRGFAPKFMRAWFAATLAHYERRDTAFDADCEGLRIVSGCFMVMRMSAFQAVGGFDPRFFLYFEDFDLSLRVSEKARVVRLAGCEILHGGGAAARKGLRHTIYFMRAAWWFFAKHGVRYRGD